VPDAGRSASPEQLVIGLVDPSKRKGRVITVIQRQAEDVSMCRGLRAENDGRSASLSRLAHLNRARLTTACEMRGMSESLSAHASEGARIRFGSVLASRRLGLLADVQRVASPG
jgi:hypothetical protein